MKFSIRLLDNESGEEKVDNVEAQFVHTAVDHALKKRKKTSNLTSGHYTIEVRSLEAGDDE